MIAHVNGILTHKTADSVVVDVNGVGYEVFIPLSTYYKLPEHNERVALSIHTHLKEDSIQLYGFLTREEKEVFQLLISVSGVGPKLARNILSGIGVAELLSAITDGNKARLGQIPGIGAKSAERLILELREKAKEYKLGSGVARPEEAPRDTLTADVVSALSNLGYKPAQAEDAVRKARQGPAQDSGFEALFKETLRLLSKR